MDCSEIHLKFIEHRKDVIYLNPPLIKSGFDFLKYLFFPTNETDLRRISKISIELRQNNSDDNVVYSSFH